MHHTSCTIDWRRCKQALLRRRTCAQRGRRNNKPSLCHRSTRMQKSHVAVCTGSSLTLMPWTVTAEHQQSIKAMPNKITATHYDTQRTPQHKSGQLPGQHNAAAMCSQLFICNHAHPATQGESAHTITIGKHHSNQKTQSSNLQVATGRVAGHIQMLHAFHAASKALQATSSVMAG